MRWFLSVVAFFAKVEQRMVLDGAETLPDHSLHQKFFDFSRAKVSALQCT